MATRMLLAGLGLMLAPALAEAADGHAGGLGAWSWELPATPDGLEPTQSWHATGSTPEGDIYVGGMDHATNAALYRIDSRAGTLRYVGDARAASEAAHNWRQGETAEKFHTRPLSLGGKVYVATMDRSTLDDAYLSRRGFHWYAYDKARATFADLSAGEPGGTGAAHGALVSLAGDRARNVIYGAAVPTGDIYRYDVATGRTQDLGRPSAYDRPYLYVGRVMWVDTRGRLYFTAGSPQYGSHDPAIYAHVRFWDPGTGFGERTDWPLQEPRALEVGQCLDGGRRCFFADDQGHLYRFDDDGPSWTYLGKAELPAAELWVWLFHVSADGRKAYLGTSSWAKNANPAPLYEFDLEAGTTRLLCNLAELDPALSDLNLHTGYDAWDADGRFYFSSFAMGSRRHVVVTRVDPVRLKVAKRVLPALAEVSVDRAPGADGKVVFSRTGDLGRAQDILYRLLPADGSPERRGIVTIPADAASVEVAPGDAPHGSLAVVPNGDDYVAATKGTIAF